MNNFEVQTRSEKNGLRTFPTIKEAMQHAEEDETVWKVSFPVANGERVRLVRGGIAFEYQAIFP